MRIPPCILVTTTATQLLTSSLLAEAPAARAYVQEARELIQRQDYDKAISKLELADAELEDVKGADKAALAALIKEAQGSITAARAAADKPKYLRKIRNLMDDAESGIGNLVTWPGTERQLTEIFADTTARAAIPEELATAEKKFATFKKLHFRKAAVELAAQVENEVQGAEKQWAESKPLFSDQDASPNSRSSAVERTGRYVESARKRLAQLPPEDDITKKLALRLDTVAGEFTAIALADQTKEVVEQLKRSADLYTDEYEGWEKEKEGPTWEAFTKETSEKMSAFLAPRTRAYRERAEGFLANLEQNSNYAAVAGAAEVKAIVDDVRAKLQKANASLLKRVQSIVATAERAIVKDPSDLDRLDSGVRLALGEDSVEGKALRAKIKARIDALEAATTGADNALVVLIQTLRKKAEEVWPGLYEGMTYATDIDLKRPGQRIGFLADNLMGYRFKPGDFYFATTLGGHPVAAKFDPPLAAGIRAMEEKIGRALGDDDNDGKWDVIAVVTNQKVKLLAKRQSEAKGTIDGVEVKLTGEYAEPVDAVVIEIIAAKCGPFAGAKGRGVLKPDGIVGK